MSFLHSSSFDDVYSSDASSLWALTSLDTTQSDSHAETYYDPRDNNFSVDIADSFAAIASAATQDVVIGMAPFASKQPALTRLETHHALPTPNLLAPRANGTVATHRFELDDPDSDDEEDCDAQVDGNISTILHSSGEPLPPSPPMSSEATSPCSSRDFDPDSSESSSEMGDDIRSRGEGGEAQNGEDRRGRQFPRGRRNQENHVDEGDDVDGVGETDDEADEADAEDSAADAYAAGGNIEMTSASEFGNANDVSVVAVAPLRPRLTLHQAAGENYTAEAYAIGDWNMAMYNAGQFDYEMESEDANDASVVAPLLPRLIRNLPAHGRIAQAPSPIAGTSHSMAVDTRKGEDNQFSDPDDEDEYAPAVKRARTNSGKAVGKQGKRKVSEQKRRAVESDPPACKWEKRAGRYACLWPGCEHSVKTASGHQQMAGPLYSTT
ncbi:hypothetical protein DFH06DRAFT_1322787 [Mycena polygramma]|nr:hypothetical protein DFH06DRAFT_1322787 [Mycena polygramma]